MPHEWSTKEDDMLAAQGIMEEYAHRHETDSLGFFEVRVEPEGQMVVGISGWIVTLCTHFESLYGEEEGDRVARQVLTQCMVGDQLVH